MNKKLKHNTSQYSKAKAQNVRYFMGYGNQQANLLRRKNAR